MKFYELIVIAVGAVLITTLLALPAKAATLDELRGAFIQGGNDAVKHLEGMTDGDILFALWDNAGICMALAQQAEVDVTVFELEDSYDFGVCTALDYVARQRGLKEDV